MDKYYYEFEQDSIYCYPDSFILKNKLNIREQDVLEEAERNITALRILELKEKPLKGILKALRCHRIAGSGRGGCP